MLYLRYYFGRAEKKKKDKEPLRSLRSRFASRVHRKNLFKKSTCCARSSRFLFCAKGALAHARGRSACWLRESLPRDCLAFALSALGVKSVPSHLPPAGVPRDFSSLLPSGNKLEVWRVIPPLKCCGEKMEKKRGWGEKIDFVPPACYN